MDKKKVFAIVLVIYLNFASSKETSLIQTTSSSTSTGTSRFTSSRLIENTIDATITSPSWAAPTPSLSWMVLAQAGKISADIKTQSLTKSYLHQNLTSQSSTSSSVGNSINLLASMHFPNPSISFHISSSAEIKKPTEVSIGHDTVTYSSKFTEYLSNSKALHAFSISTHHTMNSLTSDGQNTPQKLFSNTSAFSHYISALSQSAVIPSISQYFMKQSEGHRQSPTSAYLPSLAILNNSIITSIVHNSSYMRKFVINETITHSLKPSYMNITHMKSSSMQTQDLKSHDMNITTQYKSIFSSPSDGLNNTHLDIKDPSYNTPFSDFISMSSSLVPSSFIQLQSMKVIQPSPQSTHSVSMTFYDTKVPRDGSVSIPFPKLNPTTSIPSFHEFTKKFGFQSKHDIPPSETFIFPFVTPTIENPSSDIDVKEKNKEYKGFPAWIAILTSVGAFAAILLIIAVAVRFIRWNKDHGDYALWASNLELQPITSRNAEVLT